MKQVTAAIVKRDGRILAARRRDDDALAGKWEFPGGKIEPGESAEACLHRELEEELGLQVTIERFFSSSHFNYPKGQIELLAYLCIGINEPTKLNAHAEIRWAYPEELLTLDFAPADVPICKKLIAEWPV